MKPSITENMPDPFSVLESIPLFKGLSHNTLAYFLEHARQESVSKGKILLLQGDEAKYFYLVLDGWIKLFRDTLDGNEAVIDVLTTNHMFGETAIFDGGHYSWSAQVVEDARLMVWPTSMLKEQVELHNQIALNMLHTMAVYQEQRDQELEHLKIQNAPQRIGCFLLRLCPDDWTSGQPVVVNLPYDKSLLAMRLGMKSETFSRALAILKKEAAIEIRGATVLVNNLSQLSRYCCGGCSNEFPCKDLA